MRQKVKKAKIMLPDDINLLLVAAILTIPRYSFKASGADMTRVDEKKALDNHARCEHITNWTADLMPRTVNGISLNI